MKYSVQYNDSGICLFRVHVPAAFASSFLAFIEQKNRENIPSVKKASSGIDENYFIKLQSLVFDTFDSFVAAGLPLNLAVSKTNYAVKALGYANISYESVRGILSKSGRFRSKKR